LALGPHHTSTLLMKPWLRKPTATCITQTRKRLQVSCSLPCSCCTQACQRGCCCAGVCLQDDAAAHVQLRGSHTWSFAPPQLPCMLSASGQPAVPPMPTDWQAVCNATLLRCCMSHATQYRTQGAGHKTQCCGQVPEMH
jgi:hypothetical protein